MKLLVVAPSYPHPIHPAAGTFNERCVHALKDLCDHVEVLIPRPYAPPILSSMRARWKIYSQMASYEVQDGIHIRRPAYLQVPKFAGAFWTDPGIFFWCRRIAAEMYHRQRFEAILSFDLIGVGGLAWRLGRYLRIPASGWATGSDVHSPASLSHRKIAIRALNYLEVVFYQSHELLEKAAALLHVSPAQMPQDRHIVLSRGIPTPPALPRLATREKLRASLGIADKQIVVMYTGRIVHYKGMFELLEAISLAATRDDRVVCIMVGSNPAFDETRAVQRKIDETPLLRRRVKLLPACSPTKVWEYLATADIFAFPSYAEGMPNALLEAMAMGLPAIAFAIPSIQEIEAGKGGLLTVPPFNSALFAETILHLVSCPERRMQIGEKARDQVKERFSVQKNMAEALRILSQIMKRYHKL
jgi:glycosyltransferase involved in cell wall biosynthesis